MSTNKILKDLEQIKVKALKIISNNPKDEEGKEIISLVDMTIDVFKEEAKKENKVEAYGSIEIEIDDFIFKKDERNLKGIEIYKVDKDGLYEFLETKKICTPHLNAITDIESLKAFAREHYYYNKIINLGE